MQKKTIKLVKKNNYKINIRKLNNSIQNVIKKNTPHIQENNCNFNYKLQILNNIIKQYKYNYKTIKNIN